MIKNNQTIKIFIWFIVVTMFFSHISFSQLNSIKTKIEEITKTIDGKVGVAIMDLETRDTLTIYGNNHFPMQSVYKFPLAFAVLDQVDKGKFSLDQKIKIKKKDLLPKTYSPLRDKYPNGDVSIPLSEVISYTVSSSDNNGCDILFRLLGGVKKVDKYIHSIGVKDISISATEEEMHKDWNVQFTNWCSPIAMLNLLDILYQKKHLSKSSHDFLWKIMTETSTGPKRIKGLLPKNTLVTHKTGSSGTNDKGITAATNDVGIVTLPNGKHFAIVVFVSNTTAKDTDQESVIAKISKTVWDFFTANK